MITVSGKRTVVEDVTVEEIDVVNQLFYNWLQKTIITGYGGVYNVFKVEGGYWTALDLNGKRVTLRPAAAHEIDMWNAFNSLRTYYERE